MRSTYLYDHVHNLLFSPKKKKNVHNLLLILVFLTYQKYNNNYNNNNNRQKYITSPKQRVHVLKIFPPCISCVHIHLFMHFNDANAY